MKKKTILTFKSAQMVAVSLSILGLACSSAHANPPAEKARPHQQQVTNDQEQMLACFKAGNYAWCIEYAKRAIDSTHNVEEKAVAEYYTANSLTKLNRLKEAGFVYMQAKDTTTDQTLKANCDSALRAIEKTLNPGSRSPVSDNDWREHPDSPKDSVTDEMLNRSAEQFTNSETQLLGGSRVLESLLKDVMDDREREKYAKRNLQYYLSLPVQDSVTIQREEGFRKMITGYESNTAVRLNNNPQLRTIIENRDKFEEEQKESLSHTGKVNSEPKLQMLGTDYYTKNYSAAAAAPRPIPPGEPNELVATPERMILDAHSTPGRTISRIVKVPPQSEPSNAALKVQGNIIPEANQKNSTGFKSP